MPGHRDPWLDNAKLVLITSVVVGHLVAVVPGDEALRLHFYNVLYVVHMPAFVLVSGYLSRNFRWSRRHLTSLVTTLLVPYVVFTLLLHQLYALHVGEPLEEPMFLDPYYALWFLAALALWRLATPVLRAHPAMVPASIVVGVLAPLWDAGPELALNRALQFLPFFVVGLHARREWLDVLHRTSARVVAGAVLVGLWVMTREDEPWGRTEWLYQNQTFDALGVDASTGILTRVVLLVWAFAGAIAVLSLVPRRGGWWTRMGAETMTVYLGHTLVVKAVQYDRVLREPEPAEAFWWAIGLGLVVTVVFASPPVVRGLRWLTDPVGALRSLRAAPTSDAPRSAAPSPAREPARV